MKTLLISWFAVCSLGFASNKVEKADQPVPSGLLSVYEAVEGGEVIAMVEVNASKQMLVYFKNVAGPLNGTSKVYLLRDAGNGRKDVYSEYKKGSKTKERWILEYNGSQWIFFDPNKDGAKVMLKYSKAESKAMPIEEALKAYQP